MRMLLCSMINPQICYSLFICKIPEKISTKTVVQYNFSHGNHSDERWLEMLVFSGWFPVKKIPALMEMKAIIA